MAFKPLLQEVWFKNLSESFSKALTSKLWNKKKYMLQKLTEMERNWIIFTPYGFIKYLQLIHVIGEPHEIHWKKKKCWQYHVSKITQRDLSKTIKHRKFLCSIREAGAEASKHLASRFTFSDFQILSSFLGCYFSGISCTFRFWQMLNRFFTSTFDFYWSLALQFSCIMVRHSQGMFLFAVASN